MAIATPPPIAFDQIEFQLSLLNIACLGEAPERHTSELEQLLTEPVLAAN